MPRRLTLFVGFTLAIIFCVPAAHGQDSPSLGDVARKAQKEKSDKSSNVSAKRVLTNDDISSGSAPVSSGSSSPAASAGFPPAVQSTAANSPQASASPTEQLAQMGSMLDQIDSLDRATLARNVLQDAADVNFPGRSAWEERLFAAKQVFVSQGRALLQKARQIEASAASVKDTQDTNDPRVKQINNKVQELSRDAANVGVSFQAVVAEGRELAAQASGR